MKIIYACSFLTIIVFSVILIFFSTTQNSHAEDYVKIVSFKNRIEVPGISMLPPQEDGWSYIKRHPARTEFGKIGLKEGQSFVGVAVLTKMPIFQSEKEFLEFISKERSRDSSNTRYEEILNKETILYRKDTICVHFHTKYKDFGATNLPKTSPYLVVEDYGANCIHGMYRDIGVSIGLSQRSKPEDADPNFETLSHEFIKNMQFTAIEE